VARGFERRRRVARRRWLRRRRRHGPRRRVERVALGRVRHLPALGARPTRRRLIDDPRRRWSWLAT